MIVVNIQTAAGLVTLQPHNHSLMASMITLGLTNSNSQRLMQR
jgi:hypothetical protein